MSTRGWSFPLARVQPARHRIATRIFSDVWSEIWLPEGRQRTFARRGCYRDPVDGDWGRRSAAALREFQKAAGLDVNGWWTTWVGWAVYGYGTERRHSPIRPPSALSLTKDLIQNPHTVTSDCNRVMVRRAVIPFTAMTGPQPSARAVADPRKVRLALELLERTVGRRRRCPSKSAVIDP